MIKKLLCIAAMFSCVACAQKISVEVANSGVVEYAIEDASEYVVFDKDGNEVPSQVLHNGNILFMADEPSSYYLRRGETSQYDVVACGKFYPEKMGDLAWENDKIGFRAYGKPYEVAGSKLYGYDIFTKRGNEPVLEEHLYGPEIDPENVAKYQRLLKSDPAAAQYFIKTISYHVDHGKGMDYYVVGPTLGCGTSALVVDGVTRYPTYFSTFEILDNGPLRFTLQLTYDPVTIAGDSVTEVRTISLDAGTHFNKIEVEYKGLTKPTKVIAGLVLRDRAELYQITENSVAYIEPMHDAGWQTYNALLFDDSMSGVVDLFDARARAAHNGAYGHIQAEGVYTPGKPLTYYMGASWNGWGVDTIQDWFDYTAQKGRETYKK